MYMDYTVNILMDCEMDKVPELLYIMEWRNGSVFLELQIVLLSEIISKPSEVLAMLLSSCPGGPCNNWINTAIAITQGCRNPGNG